MLENIEENKAETAPEAAQAEPQKAPPAKKNGGGSILSDILTGILAICAVGIIGFEALAIYSALSYQAQVAQAEAAAATPSSSLSGYAYSGPGISHRPDDWPEPTAEFSGRKELENRKRAQQEEKPETDPQEDPGVPLQAPEPAPKPEPEPEPASVQEPTQAAPPAGTSQQTTSSQPSNTGMAPSGTGQSSGVTIAPSGERQPSTNSGTNSTSNSSGSGFDTEKFDRPNWPSGKLLGSTESDKYHNKNCSNGAARIRPENEIWFDSVEEAESAGYKPCGNCY